MQKKIRSQISLLQGYYTFLYLGKFLEQVIKDNDLSKYAEDIPLKTGKSTHFLLRAKKIEKTLAGIYKHSDKKNVFGYITELSSFTGIFGVMRELLDNNVGFRYFAEKKLGKQFFPFEQIIRFVRNVLNHALDTEISLKSEDFEKQKQFLLDQKKHKIVFVFNYAKFFSEWKGSSGYGFTVDLDFSKLREGQSFFEIVELHELYLLAEFCYNLTEVFRVSD